MQRNLIRSFILVLFFSLLLFIPKSLFIIFVPISILSYLSPILTIGLILPFAGILTNYFLLASALLVLFFQVEDLKKGILTFLPFLIIVFSSLIFDFYYEIDFYSLKHLIGLEFTTLSNYLSNQPFGLINNLTLVLNYIIFFSLIFYFKNKDLSQLYIGLIISLTIAFLLSILDYFEIIDFLAQDYFWKKQGRYYFTFSDPNSFGLFCLLALILLFDYQKKLSAYKKYFIIFLSVVVLCLAFLSGSRTYLVGLIIFIAFVLYLNHKKYFLISLISLSALFVSHNLFSNFSSEYIINLKNLVPTGTHRIIDGLLVANINETFFSRAIFLKLNVGVINEYPLTGVGFNHFRDFILEIAHLNNINIGNWKDNTNNFYLGIISELGFIGFIAFLIVFLSFRIDKNSSPILRAGLYTFLIALFFGPHLEFIEICILFSILVAKTTNSKNLNYKFYFIPFIIIYIFIYKDVSFKVERGLYNKEQVGNKTYQWTSTNSRFLLLCENNTAQLKVKTFPQLKENPNFKIKIKYNNQEYIRSFNKNLEERISIDCQKSLMVEISANSCFFPAEHFSSNDKRCLGVQVYR